MKRLLLLGRAGKREFAHDGYLLTVLQSRLDARKEARKATELRKRVGW